MSINISLPLATALSPTGKVAAYVLKRCSSYQQKRLHMFQPQWNHQSWNTILQRRYSYSEKDITFLIPFRHDFPRLLGCLAHLRTQYPDAQVIVQSDGDIHASYTDRLAPFRVIYYQGEYLNEPEKAGDFQHRLLDVFLQHPTEFCIKIDTDTRIDRRLSYLPTASGVHGNRHSPHALNGGFRLYSHAIALQLRESTIFASATLKDVSLPWANEQGIDPILHDHRRIFAAHVKNRNTLRIIDDWVFYWGCFRLGIPMLPYDEVYSSPTTSYPNKDQLFAVMHPDKTMGMGNA